MRHVKVGDLWIQEKQEQGELKYNKVLGTSNPADLLTKHSLAKERILELIRLIGCSFREGRPEAAPQLRQGQCEQQTMAEAEAEGLTDVIAEVELLMPVVPHVAMTPAELDRYYPALVAPGELDNPDLDDQSPDVTFEWGMKVASEIEKDMVELGRTRKDGAVRNVVAAKVASSAEGLSESHQTVT